MIFILRFALYILYSTEYNVRVENSHFSEMIFMSKPVTAIIVGAGHRALIYAELAITNPEQLQIVGVADPNPVRRQMVMEKFGFSEDMCFHDADELAKHGKLADTIINGTMDHQHLETSIPLLNLGYDMLLEKPFAVTLILSASLTVLAESIPYL
mgnify:CR=1 FL=1